MLPSPASTSALQSKAMKSEEHLNLTSKGAKPVRSKVKRSRQASMGSAGEPRSLSRMVKDMFLMEMTIRWT